MTLQKGGANFSVHTLFVLLAKVHIASVWPLFESDIWSLLPTNDVHVEVALSKDLVKESPY